LKREKKLEKFFKNIDTKNLLSTSLETKKYQRKIRNKKDRTQFIFSKTLETKRFIKRKISETKDRAKTC
jgi:hypothetical protein